MSDLKEFKQELGQEVFGVNVVEYIQKGICICCNKPDALSRCYSENGAKDFKMMGICEVCYDHMFSEEAEDDEGAASKDHPPYADELPERDFWEGDSPDY